MTSLSDDKRAQLVAKIVAGIDPRHAARMLGITDEQIKHAGDELREQINQAFEIGTSRLSDRIMEAALSSDDTTTLMKLLQQRQALQSAASESSVDVNDPRVRIDTMRRILFVLASDQTADERDAWLSSVTKGRCLHCNKMPFERRPPIHVTPLRTSLP